MNRSHSLALGVAVVVASLPLVSTGLAQPAQDPAAPPAAPPGATPPAAAPAGDPAATPATAPTSSAQQDPNAPPAAPAPSPTNPPAPADASSGLTVTTGGAGTTVGVPGQPTKDAPADANAEKKKSWIDNWTGSSIFGQIGMSPDVVAPGLTQTQAASVDSFLALQPRYALSKNWQLRARVAFSYEFTDNYNTGTTYKNEPRFGNSFTDLWYRGIPSFWNGTKVQLAARLSWPTSPESQAQSMIVAPGLVAQLSKGFEHVLGGELMYIGNVSFSHPFYRYTTAGLNKDPAYAPACFGRDETCFLQGSGLANTRDALSWTTIVVGEWGKFSPGAFLLVSHNFPYKFQDLQYQGQPVDRVNGAPGVRTSTYFAAWLDYHLNDWLTPEVGYQFLRPSLDPDGKYGNPLFNRYSDGMRVYLGANIALDSLYKTLSGQQGDAGIVRAKNERRPVLQF